MLNVINYKLINPSKNKKNELKYLLDEISELVESSWGKFPKKFLIDHVLKSDKLCLARCQNKLIGFCSLKYKKVFKKRVNYIEFTITSPSFQGMGIGSRLTYLTLRSSVIRDFFLRPYGKSEVMLITPNIRVLGQISKIFKNTYPNPNFYESSNNFPEADDETWMMATEIIKSSDNPDRKIDRVGLVLEGSYRELPWLIYFGKNIPWHKNEKINEFARYYIGYGKGEDKEFIVRSQISFIDMVNIILFKLRR